MIGLYSGSEFLFSQHEENVADALEEVSGVVASFLRLRKVL
jgi:hypothetical protein